jgi:hypothetical protein
MVRVSVVVADCYSRANEDSQHVPGYAGLSAHQTNNGIGKDPCIGLRGFAVDHSFQPHAVQYAIALAATVNCSSAFMKV